MILRYVTSNVEKTNRLREALKRYGVNDVKVEQNVMFLPEPRYDDMKEIANVKASFVLDSHLFVPGPFVVQDSGFFIHSLNGFPRGFVNFALDTVGLEGILRLVDGKPRECEFRDCLLYCQGEGVDYQYFEMNTPGTLAESIKGPACIWPLHRIFIPAGETKTIAEMSEAEKEVYRASRGDNYSLNQFAKWLSESLR